MDAIFEMLLGLIPEPARAVVMLVLVGLGLLCVVVMAFIKFSPSKHDDEMLASVKAIPVIGALLAWLVGKAPVQDKP